MTIQTNRITQRHHSTVQQTATLANCQVVNKSAVLSITQTSPKI